MSVKPIPMQEFTEKVGNIYEAIVVTAKRARQIHDDVKIELAQQLETIKALTTTTDVEEELETATTNPDQLKISLEFEKRPKATELALQEAAEKKIPYRYKEPFTLTPKEPSAE